MNRAHTRGAHALLLLGALAACAETPSSAGAEKSPAAHETSAPPAATPIAGAAAPTQTAPAAAPASAPQPEEHPMLQVGDVAPAFEVKDHLGRTVRLTDFSGKRVVLWFYPKASTPGCTKEGCGFRDRIQDYQAKGIAVLGISFDTVADNKAFADAQGFNFPLLSDPDRKVGLAYKACTSATDGYAKRYTYVIGADGKIEQAIDTKDPAGQAASLLKTL